MTEAKLKIRVDSSEVSKADRTLDDLARSGGKAEQSTKRLTDASSTLAKAAVAAASAIGLAFSAREIIQYSDAWNNAANQLRLVTSSATELATTQKILIGVSNDTRSSYESTANLFTRLTRATSEMGLSQTELIGITKTINQSFAVAGATAGEASAAITQLSQGLAAGALRGDEFNSVAEQAPGIMRAIADSLNMTVGDLRAFAAEGGITAKIVVDALKEASDSIGSDFSKATITFGQSVVVARNNMLEFVGTNEILQASIKSLGESFIWLSDQGLKKTETFFGTIRFLAEELAASINGPAMDDLARVYERIADIDREIAQLSAYTESHPRLEALAAERTRLNELLRANEELAEGQRAVNQQMRIQEIEITAQRRALRDYLPDLDEYGDKNREIIHSLSEELSMLRMTGEEQAVYNALKRTGEHTTAEFRDSVADLAAQLYREKSAIEAAEEAQKEAAETASRAAEQMDRDFARTRDAVGVYFADIVQNGDNAVDAILKSWERMILEMVGQLIASDLLKLVGSIGNALSGQGGALGAIGGVINAIPGIGNAASSTGLVSAVGGILGGGGAAAASGSAAGVATQFAGAGAGIAGGGGGSLLSGASSLIGSIPGWGWALGGAALLAGIASGSDSHDTAALIFSDNRAPGNSSLFSEVPKFASGVDSYIHHDKVGVDTVQSVIKQFAELDSLLTQQARAAGLVVNLKSSDFAMFNSKGLGINTQAGVGIVDSLQKYAEHFTRLVNQRNGIGTLSSSSSSRGYGGIDGSYRTGLDYVPFDGFRAELHKGEKVLTAREADALRGGNSQPIIVQLQLNGRTMQEIYIEGQRSAQVRGRV